MKLPPEVEAAIPEAVKTEKELVESLKNQ